MCFSLSAVIVIPSKSDQYKFPFSARGLSVFKTCQLHKRKMRCSYQATHIEDAILLKGHLSNENRALTDMVDRSMMESPALIIADIGFESYNNMAHIQKRGWKYLIRIKDHGAYTNGILHGFALPSAEEFDVDKDLRLTRKQTNEVKKLLKDKNHYRLISNTQTFDYLPEKSKMSDPTILYSLPFRIVRFPGVVPSVSMKMDFLLHRRL